MLVIVIPGTKRGPQGQDIQQPPQKGPTCWYYAARFVREFHSLTFKHYPLMNDTPERAEERKLSAIRKRITQFDSLVDAVNAPQAAAARNDRIILLVRFLRALPGPFQEFLRARFPKLDNEGQFADAIKALARLQFDGVMQQFQEMMIPLSLGLTSNNGAWVVACECYGFMVGDLATLGAVSMLEEQLRKFGPGVAVGRYSLNDYNMQTTDFQIGGANLHLNARYVGDDINVFHASLHAIALCGTITRNIGGVHRELVLYVDPNFPGRTYAMDFYVFKTRREHSSEENLLFLKCSDQASCPHLAARSISG